MPATKNGTAGAKGKVKAERPIIYPEIDLVICADPARHKKGVGVMTADQAMKLVGWESEPEYAERRMAEDTSLKESKAKFGNNYLFKDKDGVKIQCWNNAKNRPFDENHAKKLAQDILQRNWRLNLENIIVSKYGTVTSGQHRLIALILAVQEWHLHKGKEGHWGTYWDTEPYMETTIAFGGEEDDATLRTLDNVKPRTLADVFYTLPMFAKMNPSERKECSRMMDFAVDFLWKRTRAATEWAKFQTHSASLDFYERHPRLLKCVAEMHKLNSGEGRAISNLGLSPGQCAAMLYLMGSSASDEENYYDPNTGHNEKVLDFQRWETATEFWTRLKDADDYMEPVKETLANMASEEGGRTGSEREKAAVIAKAWDVYLAQGDLAEEDLELEYAENPQTKVMSLINEPLFGGIDCGSGRPDPKPVRTPEEIEAEKAKIKQENIAAMADANRVKELDDKVKGVAKPAPSKPTAGVKPPVTIKADTNKKVTPAKPAASPGKGNGVKVPPATSGKRPAPKPVPAGEAILGKKPGVNDPF